MYNICTMYCTIYVYTVHCTLYSVQSPCTVYICMHHSVCVSYALYCLRVQYTLVSSVQLVFQTAYQSLATNCQRLASVLLRLLDSSIMLTSYQRRASVLLRIASVFPASCYDYQILAPCLRLTSVLLASCQHLATNCQQLAHVSCPQAVINNNFSYSLTCSRCI